MDFLDWLGLNRRPDLKGHPWVGTTIGFFIFSFLIASGLGLMYQFLSAVFWTGDGKGEAIRNIGLVLVGVFGAPFLVWRSIIAQKQVQVSEQSQITDRINKAVEGLGADKIIYVDDKQTTQPNLEVRLGAIYALERIAQDSLRDHIQIMEILCAYVRNNAPYDSAIKFDDYGDFVDTRTDIQTAMNVLGRRSIKQKNAERKKKYRIDLRRVSLPKFSIFDADFSGALFQSSRFDTARITNSNFSGANLSWTYFGGSKFKYAYFEKCNLSGVNFSCCNFKSLNGKLFDGSIIKGVNFLGADISDVTNIFSHSDFYNFTFVSTNTKLPENADPRKITYFPQTFTENEDVLAKMLGQLGLTGWPYDDG